MTIQPRWHSPIAWTSLGALIFFIFKSWGGFEIPGWDTFVTLATAAATSFGIFNNPTARDGF